VLRRIGRAGRRAQRRPHQAAPVVPAASAPDQQPAGALRRLQRRL